MLEILLIIVTLFFVFKLKSSFGTRNDDEETRKKAMDEFFCQKELEMKNANKNNTMNESSNLFLKNVKEKIEKKNNVININDIPKTKEDIKLDIEVSADVMQILKNINFNSDIFLQGVDSVVEMISDAFSSKDIQTLKDILSNKIFLSFEKQINDLNLKNHILKSSLISISSKKMNNIYILKKEIFIDVVVKTEQINFIEDANGKIIFGNKKQIDNVSEKWTFKRNINSKDNFWFVENIDNISNISNTKNIKI